MKSLIESGAIYELIKNELTSLPGEKAHLEMIPYRTSKNFINRASPSAKKSAVLCLLTKNNSDLKITLMERTEDGSPHSGQISFPGGKMEKTDYNLQETALRETQEELGISPKKINVLGQLTPLYIPVSNFEVTPYIGFGNQIESLKLSQREVKSVFEIDIADLNNPGNLVNRDIPNHLGHVLKEIPCFYINDKVIWGATSLILNEVKWILKSIEMKFPIY